MIKKDINYKSFVDGRLRVTYHYPSLLCDFGEVHKGIIGNGCFVDMCISYKEAVKEIKEYERGKNNEIKED